jgi:hypothetical protein
MRAEVRIRRDPSVSLLDLLVNGRWTWRVYVSGHALRVGFAHSEKRARKAAERAARKTAKTPETTTYTLEV